ncbi:MAG: hypothetical protein P8Y00_12705, partial [Deltaproteobacteria bacterium]
MERLLEEIQERTTAEISISLLKRMESLFFHLETFSQSHQHVLDQLGSDSKLPAKHRKCYRQAAHIREKLLLKFRKALFCPTTFFSDISRFYVHAPALTEFLLPELAALRDLSVAGRLYLKHSVVDYVLATARKMQALVVRDRKEFQDFAYLHRLAQREFGPMATGIIGVSQSQLNQLEKIDFSAAGAFFLEKDAIANKYDLNSDTVRYLLFLVKHHSLLHHIVRGEIALDGLTSVLVPKDKGLFDAFFVFSFAMLSALREDLMLEDLAGRLFEIRRMCREIMDEKTSLPQEMKAIYARKGDLYHGFEQYQMKGLSPHVQPSEYISTHAWEQRSEVDRISSGKMTLALERTLR